MGSVSYQLEKGPSKGLLGLFVYGIYFFVYGIYFSFIAAAVLALAGFIAAVLAVMLLASVFSAGVALWRRHVLHELGSFGEIRRRWTKRAQWGDNNVRQGQVVAAPATVSSSPPAPATVAALPPEAPLTMPKRVTQAWIEANVPNMSPAALDKFTSELRKRRWRDSDIATRVIPHTRVANEIEQLRGAVERFVAEIAER